MQLKLKKLFSVLRVIALQLVAGTSLNNDKNTRDGRQPLKKRSKDFRSD